MRLYRITCVDRAYSSLRPLSSRQKGARREKSGSPFSLPLYCLSYSLSPYVYTHPCVPLPLRPPFEASSLACVNHAYRFSFVSTSFGSRCPAVYASDDVLPLCFRAEREPGGRPLLEPLLKMR